MFYCVLWRPFENGKKLSEDETGVLFAKEADAYAFALEMMRCCNVKDVHLMCARDLFNPLADPSLCQCVKKEFENG